MSNGNYQEDYHQAGEPVPEKEIGAFEALWAFFSSMKTAIVLLLLLTAASIAGTIIEDHWGERIYSKPWFSMLVLLVGINLAVCSVNRFGLVWRTGFKPSPDATPEQVSRMSRSQKVTCSGSVESVATRVTGSLHSMHYRVVSQTSKGVTSIYADKGRASVWGPHVTHVSLLVIFIGAIFGSMFGKQGRTSILEGKRTDQYSKDGAPKDVTPFGFQLGLSSFKIIYDKHHMPAGFKSDLQVYDGGVEKTHKVIDVNQPLSYKGLTFYQASYGLYSLVMKVTAPNGTFVEVPYEIGTEDSADGVKYSVAGNPFRQISLGGKKLTLFVHNLVPDFVGGDGSGGSTLPLNPAVNVMVNDRFPQEGHYDEWGRTVQQLGWMTVSKSGPYKGYTVSLDRVVKYTVLQVSHNPALPVIYLGFALTVLGVLLCFYVTHKAIRVTVTATGETVSVVLGATSKPEPSVMEKDLKRLAEALV